MGSVLLFAYLILGGILSSIWDCVGVNVPVSCPIEWHESILRIFFFGDAYIGIGLLTFLALAASSILTLISAIIGIRHTPAASQTPNASPVPSHTFHWLLIIAGVVVLIVGYLFFAPLFD